MTTEDIKYGVVRSVKELGELARAHRKSRGITLVKIAGLANLGKRFLSEFERGKETSEIAKVLKTLNSLGLEVIVLPREIHARGKVNIASSIKGTVAVGKTTNKES